MAIRTRHSKSGTSISLTGSDASFFSKRLIAKLDPTFAYCWATGVIEFGPSLPEGAIGIAYGCAPDVEELIAGTARLAHDGKTFLVPGVPEAEGQQVKGDALAAYLNWIQSKTSPFLTIGSMEN